MKTRSSDTFISRYTLEKRLSESERILQKFPDRIPVIVEISDKASSTFPPLDKHKYLVPQDLSVGQFQYVIRKRMKLKSTEAIYMFFGENSLEPTGSVMSSCYEKHKHEDKFLYVLVASQNTFGGN
jgi:GABA(A) receptor-associated protein